MTFASPLEGESLGNLVIKDMQCDSRLMTLNKVAYWWGVMVVGSLISSDIEKGWK